MSDREKLLKENVVEYEAARRAAEKNLKENQEDIAKRASYVESLNKAVDDHRILVVWDQGNAGTELPRYMLEYLRRTYGNKFSYTCCVKRYDKAPVEGIPIVKILSPEFWEAAACSKYIISSISLPVAYIKREEQVYFNTCEAAYKKENLMDEEGVSFLSREMLKADYIYAPSAEAARHTWLEMSCFGNIYDGSVLVCGDPEKEAGVLAEAVLGNTGAGEGAVKRISLRDKKRKKLLVLTSWKNTREKKYEVKNCLCGVNTEKYDVAVLSPWVSEPGILKDYVSLSKDFAKVMYRGRMTLGEEEYMDYRILEKNPDACVRCAGLWEYMNGIMKREWQRIWGNQSFDECLVLGSQGYLQYYMAAFGRFGKKVLMDLDFLAVLKEKEPSRWQTAISVFDEIYAPTVCVSLGSYGAENREKVFRLPVCVYDKGGVKEKTETVEFGGKKYLVCDQWKQEDGTTGLRLLISPAPGSCLVNADLIPDKDRKEMLSGCLSGEQEVYLLGPNARSYQSFLPGAFVLDECLRRYMYLLPGAEDFFKNIKTYYGDKALTYDVTGEICKIYGVSEQK